jgi:Leucine-rich repeat
MKRLGTLLLANNLITRASSSLHSSLPALHSVVLTNNRIASLVEIDALSSISSLRKLSLLHNPVTRRPHYRSYVIFRMPQLTELDFQKIKRKEKVAAIKLFSGSTGQALLRDLDSIRAVQHPEITTLPSLLGKKTVGTGASADGAAGGAGAGSSSSSSSSSGGAAGFTDAQKGAIQAALSAASTAAEFAEIEEYLKRNELPPAAIRILTGGDAPVPMS